MTRALQRVWHSLFGHASLTVWPGHNAMTCRCGVRWQYDRKTRRYSLVDRTPRTR